MQLGHIEGAALGSMLLQWLPKWAIGYGKGSVPAGAFQCRCPVWGPLQEAASTEAHYSSWCFGDWMSALTVGAAFPNHMNRT